MVNGHKQHQEDGLVMILTVLELVGCSTSFYNQILIAEPCGGRWSRAVGVRLTIGASIDWGGQQEGGPLGRLL